MQDIHSIGGGRFFTGSGGGGGGGGDRRLRPHQHLHHQAQQPPVMKCPRCDSANTKFCYYNNYNLSQPRHFCKSCRRYWTKGGVLRNVPVGGGCRKTKRSKQKTPAPAEEERMKTATNSHSSSESSSLTATTTTTEAASAPPSTPAPKLAAPLAPAEPNEGGLFSEIGSLTNLMTSSSSAANSGGGVGSALPFEFGSISTQFRLNQQNLIGIQSWNMNQNQNQNQNQKDVNNQGREDDELKVQEISSMIDQTAEVDLLERSNGGGFGSLGDWQQCGDQGLFDLTNNVDQQYWSHSQWNDHDNPSLYLP